MGVALVDIERALRGTVRVYEGESQWPEENRVNVVSGRGRGGSAGGSEGWLAGQRARRGARTVFES